MQELSVKVKKDEIRVKVTYKGLSMKTSILILIISCICLGLLLFVIVLQPDEERFRKRPEQKRLLRLSAKEANQTSEERKSEPTSLHSGLPMGPKRKSQWELTERTFTMLCQKA